MSSIGRWLAACLLPLVATVSLAAAQTPDAKNALPPDTVVARQGNSVVTLADIDAFAQKMDAKQRPAFFDSPKRLEDLISTLLVQKQLAEEAEKNGLAKDPAVQAEVKLATEDALSYARLQQIKSDLKMPDFDELAKEEYIGHPEKYVTPGKLDVKHILISFDKHDEADAYTLAQKVDAEAKAHPDQFDALIEKYSEDPSKDQNHGLMPDASSKRYVVSFSTAANALKIPGEISPVVKTKFGYHVLKLVRRTSDTPRKFADVKPEIVDKLRGDYTQKAVKQHTDEIRNRPINATPEVVASLRDRYGKPPAIPLDEAASEAEHKP
jgi:peptidyl-prolyl cis-trans isomerase C